MAAPDQQQRPSLLNRLKSAVKKVTFLINFNVNRWRIASSFISGRRRVRALSSRPRSFNERLGLTSIVSSPSDSDRDHDSSNWVTPFMTPSSQISPEEGDRLQKTRSFPLQRTTSYPEEDDVDKRAEMFISNFYKNLKMERQVSLQLRYRRDSPGFESSSGYGFSP